MTEPNPTEQVPPGSGPQAPNPTPPEIPLTVDVVLGRVEGDAHATLSRVREARRAAPPLPPQTQQALYRALDAWCTVARLRGGIFLPPELTVGLMELLYWAAAQRQTDAETPQNSETSEGAPNE